MSKDPNAAIYFITFDNPGETDVLALVVDDSGLSLDEVQQLTIAANSGTFDLSFGGETESGRGHQVDQS